MVAPTLVKNHTPTSFDKFLKQCPEEGRFEWVNGEIIEPTFRGLEEAIYLAVRKIFAMLSKVG